MNDRFKFRVIRGKNSFTPEGTVYHFALSDEVGFNKDDIIEQCTGLKDKNGNLIYEGDKVEISVYGDVINEGFVETDTQYQGIVVWAKQGFYVEVADEFFYIPEEPEDVEIVGNIHKQAEQKD